MALKKRLDQLPAILGGDIENNDLMYLVHENENAETGYDSKKTTAADVGRKLLGGIEYVSELSDFPSGKQNGFDALEYLREFLIGQLPVLTTSPSPIANFNTDLALPLKSCNIEIKPKQASGTPTPSNPLPISGTDTVIVTQTGKNLINWKVDATNYEFDLPSGNYIMSWVSALPNGLWYFRGTDAQGNYYTDKTALGLSASWSHSSTTHYNYATISGTNFVFSVPVGCSKLEIFRQNTDGTIDCQIETGSTATAYEPYTATTKTVSLPETVYGGEVDVIGGSGTETYGYKDLGDLEWTYNTNNQVFYAEISDIYNRTSGQVNDAKCEIYDQENTWLAGSLTNLHFMIRGDLKYLYIKDTNYNTPQNFVTAVSGKKFIYKLATPTQITLANPIDLTAISGVNNVFGDTDGNTSVEYRESVQKYIDDNIAAVQALIL